MNRRQPRSTLFPYPTLFRSMTKPSNTGLAVNSVEWLRDNGAAWLVSDVESFYYSLNAPSTGGAALKHLPKVGVAGGLSASTYRPPPIAPVISPSLPGEGQWQRARPPGGGGAPGPVTTLPPDP